MKLTNSEKLILIMLTEIHKKIIPNKDRDLDPEFIAKAILSDNTWALEWQYSGIFTDQSEPNPSEVNEVVNYLDMWSFIEATFNRLNSTEKDSLANELGHFGTNVQFVGFDGNNETEHMSIARFMIHELQRFEEFKNRDLNSHMPTLGRYRRMYAVFEPMRRNLLDGKLPLKDLILILKSQAGGRD